jgi:hypothetical protein
MKLNAVLSTIILTFFIACNDPEPTKVTIAPGDVDLFIEQLSFEGTIENGAPPEPNAGPEVLSIAKAPSGVTVTYDNFLFLPISIVSTDGFDGVYIRLSNEFDEHSGSHYKIPLTGNANNAALMLKFGIPANIEPGLVFMSISAYKGATVSDVHTFPLEIAHPQKGCDEPGKNFRTGDQQFANRTYSFDESSFPRNNFNEIIPQRLTLKATFFEEADRIDVYVDKQWVGGTGTILAFGEAPPVVECTGPDLASQGFVSGTHYISFVVNPDQRIDVYVTGCLNSTAWEYGFNCPVGN